MKWLVRFRGINYVINIPFMLRSISNKLHSDLGHGGRKTISFLRVFDDIGQNPETILFIHSLGASYMEWGSTGRQRQVDSIQVH